MKTNLEALLEAVQRIKDESAEVNAYQMSVETEDWKALVEKVEAFEKELKEKLKGIEFVLKDSPKAPWFLGVKDTVKEVLG